MRITKWRILEKLAWRFFSSSSFMITIRMIIYIWTVFPLVLYHPRVNDFSPADQYIDEQDRSVQLGDLQKGKGEEEVQEEIHQESDHIYQPND